MDKVFPYGTPGQRSLLIFISAFWLFLLAVSSTPLGVFSYIFFNIPLILLYLCYGERPGRGVLMVAIFSLVPSLLLEESFLPALEAGATAVVMGEAIRRRFTVGRTVLMGTLASLLMGATALLATVAAGGASLSGQIEEMAGAYYRGGTLMTKEIGGLTAESKEVVEGTVRILVRLFPGILLSGSICTAFVGYWGTRRFWRRLRKNVYFDPEPLSLWASPEWMVWILIAGGIFSFTPFHWSKSVGYNVIIPSGLVYFLQGLAIMAFYFQRRNLPPLLRGLIYVPVLVYPLFWPMVAAVGLFDLWADFRRIRGRYSTS